MIILARQKKMDLFYTIKINTSMIVGSNYYIRNTFDVLKKNGNIISLGDNQLLKFIRKIKDVEFNSDEIKELIAKRKEYQSLEKSRTNSKEIEKIQDEINEKLFVPDLVSVRCDTTKKDYKYICKNGFILDISINNKNFKIKYKRLCAGAGQLRRNTAFFVNEDLYDELEHIMMCGLTKSKIGKINLAKFSAYYALYTSATNKVKTPKICVVKDFEYTLKDQKVAWIYDNENGEKDIQEKTIDFDINAFDGSGMVSPEFARIWQENLTLDYLPSSFIIRSAWVKGLVSVFDFKKFAKEVAHKDEIVDAWGNVKKVEDIDVILTTSQFKMWKKYQSWEEYMYYHQRCGHIFGVARVNKKENDFMTTLNYQYIQSNEFTEDSIKSLANYTIDWIKKIMSCDKLFTMLLLMGCQEDESSSSKIESDLDSNIAKVLMYEDSILNDTYIRQKISKLIEKKIRQTKIGKLYVEGSYDFSIPDLYAMAEHAFGMEVHGLLKEKQCWNKRWVDKGATTVSIMRSPLVAPAENQLMNIYSDDKCLEWYKYIVSGNITNVWDMMAIRCSDSDYDGDILLVSDNKYLVEAVNDNLSPITYQKKKAKEQRLNFNNFATMDTKSFNSKIGQITNLASTLISMLSDFPKDSPEYKEIRKRIDLLRFYQGSAIDATKGDIFIPPPAEWSKRRRYIPIPENATKEEIEKIHSENSKISFNNRICANVKPYFFGYIYDREMKKYKAHKNKYNKIATLDFGTGLKDILSKENASKEEVKFKKNFYRYSPLKRSKSTMNTLAMYVEDIEFDNKWNHNSERFDYRVLMYDKEFCPNKNTVKRIKEELKNFFSGFKDVSIFESNTEQEYGEEYEYENTYIYMFEYLENKLNSIISNRKELVDYVIYVTYTYYKTYSKNFLWDVFGDTILENVKMNSTKFYYPCESDSGVEYLGKKYIMKEGVLNKTV